MIYTVGGVKGGCGKSTVATNLAIYLAQQGRDVLLIDADDQETAYDFTTLREEREGTQASYAVMKQTGSSIRREVPKFKARFQDIVIDTGGRDTDSQRASLTISDVYLVPFVPRSFDIWTLERVDKLIDEARTVNENLKAFVFLNRADARGDENSDAAEMLSESKQVIFIDAPLGYRKAFSTAAASGLGVVELKAADDKAAVEFRHLMKKISDELKKK
ncbi:AAA family ATPase [Spirosoma migulaei]